MKLLTIVLVVLSYFVNERAICALIMALSISDVRLLQQIRVKSLK